MNTQQPEALRLADKLDNFDNHNSSDAIASNAADELRRLHSVNAELLESLQAIANGSGFAPAKNLEKARLAIAKAQE